MRAISPADLQKWMPPSDLLSVDLASFGKWMLTLAVSIFIVGAAVTGTLNLVSNYAVRPATPAVPAQSPAALRSVEPIQLVTQAAAEEAPVTAPPAPTVTATAPAAATPVESTATPAPSETPSAATQDESGQAAPGGPRMMATLSLAVRSHPQKASPQVGALQQGEIVTIQGEDGGWYLVTSSDGATGWSWGRYLKPVAPNVVEDSPFWSGQGEDVAFAR
ncbi:MAG TPA: SH3 domain-containing protein [Devosia sp.]|nr:SH3 domain-containing protein [Devosia sp.]